MPDRIDQLNERFAIDGAARFETGEGGLARLVLTTDEAIAAVYPHGAHVSHFQPRGQAPVLWMSDSSRFAAGQPIRGGVPIVFPWFGARKDDPDAPAHGLVRQAEWAVSRVEQIADARLLAEFAIAIESFDVAYRVTVGHHLRLEMVVTNTSAHPASFEQALHTYFAVGNIRRVRVHGLEGIAYIDKVDGFKRKMQPSAPVMFTGETDSVYLDTNAIVRIEDPAMGRSIVIGKTGSRSTVVWNPWIEKSKKMADFGDDEWPGMVCVETANVADNTATLASGATSTMSATIAVE